MSEANNHMVPGPSLARFYTKKEVAEILKVSLRTVERYMTYGMPYTKIRGSVRIPENMLIKWLEEKNVD